MEGGGKVGMVGYTGNLPGKQPVFERDAVRWDLDLGNVLWIL